MLPLCELFGTLEGTVTAFVDESKQANLDERLEMNFLIRIFFFFPKCDLFIYSEDAIFWCKHVTQILLILKLFCV